MAVIQKTRDNKGWRGCGGKGARGGMQISAAIPENGMEVPRTLKLEPPHDPQPHGQVGL